MCLRVRYSCCGCSLEAGSIAVAVLDIIKGVSNIVPKVQAVLVDMETKYKKIWDTDKSAYMRRYKRNAAQRDFDGDIRHYLQLIDEIRSEESVINVQFLQIDQQPEWLEWRLGNPSREYQYDDYKDGTLGVSTKVKGYNFHVARLNKNAPEKLNRGFTNKKGMIKLK